MADEAQVRLAQAELAADGFDFALGLLERTWAEYLAVVERNRCGIDLPQGRVPATMLLAFVGNNLVGRVHIRHVLNDALMQMGGHIGYGVRPAFRRNGYATEMLRQGLERLKALEVACALVTCDESNLGSIRTIKACGGVREIPSAPDADLGKRRYWIALA